MRSPACFLILSASLSAILIAGSGVRAGDSPDAAAYKLDTGPYTALTIKEQVLRDEKRQKDLPLRIIHPDAQGPFPIIVWSHGAGGSKDNYLLLTEYWASHGYVVIQPSHSDSRSLGTRLDDPNRFRDWQSRPADVSFILDSLEAMEKTLPVLAGKLDGTRVGVGGHSFGANTAQLVGGAKTFLATGEKSFADNRVKAIILLSGQGPGEMLRETSWEKFAPPMLVMTGSRDGPTRTGQPAEWRKKPYELSPAGNKYLVWVEGLDHGYGGVPGVRFNPKNQKNATHVKLTKIATLAFWDAYLNDRSEARVYLRSNKLPAFSAGTLTLEHK
jgi:predicted dienelactone hydrolase